MLTGFYRIASGVPRLQVADPVYNAGEIMRLFRRAASEGAAALVLPELCVSGYTCGDLFEQRALLSASEEAVRRIVDSTAGSSMILLVGTPVRWRSRLFNAAAVIQDGRLLGLCGKTYLPNYREFYEKRQFRSIREFDGGEVDYAGFRVPMGGDLVFDAGGDFVFGAELCEDMWAVIPPSASLALNGAKLIFNLSAGPELAGKAEYRRSLVSGLSARYSAVYVLAGAGVHESTSDLVFSGHAVISENGRILAENARFEQDGALIFSECRPAWMEQQRRSWTSFNDVPAVSCRRVACAAVPECRQLQYREVPSHPFVPESAADRSGRCRELFAIQATGLAKRVRHAHVRRLVVGLSGGLDSTLALLVCAECCHLLQLPPTLICAVTMPGMGTGSRTYRNAVGMAREIGCELREIPIGAAVRQHFADIGHDPEKLDVVYENAQARERTQILMDLANELGGIVIGTGDLSEIALGWSTYNGDHMSMYCVNCGIPKSLVRYMVEYRAAAASSAALAQILRDVNDTPVSPELLPGGNQHTESILGSYDLHDFFLYYFLRYAECRENLRILAQKAFGDKFTAEQMEAALRLFMRRFFSQQFKRNCMPDGPKVGTVALSPRGDWRMPSDAAQTLWE